MSANEQFFVGAQTAVSLLQTTQIKQGVSFTAVNKFTPAQIKPQSFESRRNSFFTQGGCASCLRACLGARSVNMVFPVTSTETTRLKLGTGRRPGGKGGYGSWGRGRYIYLSLHCHHQNDSCIKMDSDESHFNVSVGNDGHSHWLRQCPQTTTFLKREESRSSIEPRSFRLPA